MTTISPGTAAVPATTAASSVGSLTSATDQQDRFMKLLVAQMKNQDPLNPMDNAQMTSQVAQINTVGGIEKLNTTVASLLAAFNRMQAQSATQLAGREVLVDGSSLQLAHGAATGGFSLQAAADHVHVDIVDASGATVRSIALGATGAGTRTFEWDGLTNDGSQAPDGSYRVRVTAKSAAQDVAATALTRATVQAVSQGPDGSPLLDLGPAGVVAQDAIRATL